MRVRSWRALPHSSHHECAGLSKRPWPPGGRPGLSSPRPASAPFSCGSHSKSFSETANEKISLLWGRMKKGLAGLNEFLRQSRGKLLAAATAHATSSETRVVAHVVMGNEASDMDSMVSSSLHAFLRSLSPLPTQTGMCLSHSHTVHQQALMHIGEEIGVEHFYAPVMNIPREDFTLRTEAAWLFDKVGLSGARLLSYANP